MGGALGGSFERGRADKGSGLRIDELLIKTFGRDADAVADIGEFELGKQVEQGRLVKSHRVLSFV